MHRAEILCACRGSCIYIISSKLDLDMGILEGKHLKMQFFTLVLYVWDWLVGDLTIPLM